MSKKTDAKKVIMPIAIAAAVIIVLVFTVPLMPSTPSSKPTTISLFPEENGFVSGKLITDYDWKDLGTTADYIPKTCWNTIGKSRYYGIMGFSPILANGGVPTVKISRDIGKKTIIFNATWYFSMNVSSGGSSSSYVLINHGLYFVDEQGITVFSVGLDGFRPSYYTYDANGKKLKSNSLGGYAPFNNMLSFNVQTNNDTVLVKFFDITTQAPAITSTFNITPRPVTTIILFSQIQLASGWTFFNSTLTYI